MALRYPGLPPQVRSGLLGPYRRRNEAGYVPPGRAGGGGGGGAAGGYMGGQPMDTTLTGKYLRDMPAINVETDPAKLYEGQIGGYRSDVESAMTEAGQRAISTAAASGREVADVMARYLPEAVKGYGRGAADIAGSAMQQAQQGQVAKSELELKRQELSTTMEQWDKSAQIQQQQFLSQMQQDYQMHREKLANNLRIAQAQASSQRELQSIQNSYAIQMEQMKQQYAMRASQFSEAQQNARQSKLLQTYDKWKQGSYNQSQLDQIMKGIQQIQGATPPMVPGGTPNYAGTPQGAYAENAGLRPGDTVPTGPTTRPVDWYDSQLAKLRYSLTKQAMDRTGPYESKPLSYYRQLYGS